MASPSRDARVVYSTYLSTPGCAPGAYHYSPGSLTLVRRHTQRCNRCAHIHCPLRTDTPRPRSQGPSTSADSGLGECTPHADTMIKYSRGRGARPQVTHRTRESTSALARLVVPDAVRPAFARTRRSARDAWVLRPYGAPPSAMRSSARSASRRRRVRSQVAIRSSSSCIISKLDL